MQTPTFIYRLRTARGDIFYASREAAVADAARMLEVNLDDIRLRSGGNGVKLVYANADEPYPHFQLTAEELHTSRSSRAQATQD